MILSLVKEPDPILRRTAKDVREISGEIHRLIADMIETMHAAEGVGLAANQIGSSLNIFVASADGAGGKELVFLNASIAHQSGQIPGPEGCLSLPGISSNVTRSSQVVVEGLDQTGKFRAVEAQGLLARIFQHELDHLQGHLYIDRLPLWERKQLLKKYRGLREASDPFRVE